MAMQESGTNFRKGMHYLSNTASALGSLTAPAPKVKVKVKVRHYLSLVGKPLIDFLFVIIELFRYLTVEMS